MFSPSQQHRSPQASSRPQPRSRTPSPSPLTPLPNNNTNSDPDPIFHNPFPPTRPLRIRPRSQNSNSTRPRANTVQFVNSASGPSSPFGGYGHPHETEDRRRSDPTDLIDAAKTRDVDYSDAIEAVQGKGHPQGRRRSSTLARLSGMRAPGGDRDFDVNLMRPPLVEHRLSYIRRPRNDNGAGSGPRADVWSGWDKETERMRRPERTPDAGSRASAAGGVGLGIGGRGGVRGVGDPSVRGRSSTISKYGNPNGGNVPLELPQYTSPVYRGPNAIGRDGVSTFGPMTSTSGNLPSQNQSQNPAKKRTLTQKLKDVFHRITAEPVIVSPPPSVPLSRSNSYESVPSRTGSVPGMTGDMTRAAGGNLGGSVGVGVGMGVDERGRTRARGRATTFSGGGSEGTGPGAMGRLGVGGVNLNEHPDPYGNDMLLRSIGMNGEREKAKETIWDEVDGWGNVDGHGHGHRRDLGIVSSVAQGASGLRNRHSAKDRSDDQQNGSRDVSRNASRDGSEVDSEADTIIDSAPSSPGGEGGDGDKSLQRSYRQRRKRRKHRIVYNRDTVEAQQRFILTLSKSLLVFGSLSHRIEPQLESVAAVFNLPAQFDHVPGCIQVSFGITDPTRHKQSTTLFIKATSALDLGRIHETHKVYRRVVRDEISATEGRKRLEALLAREPMYGKKALLLLTFVQGFILCGTSFGGSLNDMWVAGILATLVAFAQQIAARSELSSSGADIFIAAVVSFTARALSLHVPNRIFCYQSISSASVTGMLPGSLMLAGVLDIASRNIQLGAPKLVTGLLTSLYLGFGLTLGSDVWLRIDARGRSFLASIAGQHTTLAGAFHGTNATTAEVSLANLTGIFSFTAQPGGYEKAHTRAGCFRDPEMFGRWNWALTPLPWYTLFVLLPALNLVLSLKRNQPWKTREMPVMIIISCISNAITRVGNRKFGLSGHPDYAALVGSFIVSLLGNLWSRKFGGTAFTVMLTGIWLLIPTGLSEAGGLANTYHLPGEDEYTSSLSLARKMISVIIGVMSGVYLSARIVYTFGKRKNSALMTF